jgi:hypothetical protein
MLRAARTAGLVKPHRGIQTMLNGRRGPEKKAIKPKQTDGIRFDAE